MPKHFLAVCLCIVALYGCQSTNQSSAPTQATGQPDSISPTVVNTKTKDPLRQSYATLQDRNDRDVLKRARTTLETGNAVLALALLQTFASQPENPNLASSYHRLMASTLLTLGDAQAAGRALSKVTVLQLQDLPMIQNICAALNAIDCIVQTQLMTQRLSGRYHQTQQDQVWATMQDNATKPTSIPSQSIETTRYLLSAAQQIPQLKGAAKEIRTVSALWQDLHGAIIGAGSLPMAQKAWLNWQAKNTRHPAANLPPTALQRLQDYRPPKISVMLPLSGRLTTVGNAVRNGFVTGYLEDLLPTQTTQNGAADITFFDSNQLDDRALVALSDENNSDVIIGPLVKARAFGMLNALTEHRLNNSAETKMPSVVLLNRVGAAGNGLGTSSHVYQFAAAIEDEALTLAETLESLGHARLMVVSNGEPWAERAKEALYAQWQGPIVEANFQQTKDLTRAVGDAMGVSDSQQRREQLKGLLGEELEFLPRERKDIEAIVTFTDALQSKALVPALKFHFADDLPVFATSQTARSKDLGELANFRITELPLLTKPNATARSMTATFDLKDNPLIEFFALGLDAYRLATWTHWLNENQAALGDAQTLTLVLASGTLALGRQSSIKRRLDMATIDRRGNVRPAVGNER